MNKIERVKIDKFWDDKEVTLKLNDDVNFLLGLMAQERLQLLIL